MTVDPNIHKTRILPFSETAQIFEAYLACWPNGRALRWARIVWQTLTEAGATVFTTEEEELRVRSYAVALSLVYYEYCYRSSWHEDNSFRYWSGEIIQHLRTDLPDTIDEIEDLLDAAIAPLTSRFSQMALPLEFWISCVESSRGFPLTVEETVLHYRRFVENLEYDPMYESGKEFVIGAVGFGKYDSISGSGYFD